MCHFISTILIHCPNFSGILLSLFSLQLQYPILIFFLRIEMLTPFSLNKVSTFIAVIGAVYMKLFLPDSVIDDRHLYTPIISQQKPTVSSVDAKLERNKHLLKALRSFKDLTSFLTSRYNNFLSSPPIKETFFFSFCHNYTPLIRFSSFTITQAAIVAFFSNLADVGLHGSMLVFFFSTFHIPFSLISILPEFHFL